VPWDIVYDNTSRDIAQQLDLASVAAGGFDPVMYIRKYPGRTLTMHMKDHAPDKKGLLLGEGALKWQEIFDAAETAGGIQWYLVEQEVYPFPPLESVAKSLENLRKLLSQRKG
jgi:sugar phosphate isomerase/epimerase